MIILYADLALNYRVGGYADLVPLNHPNKQFNGRWITAGPIVRVRTGIDGPLIYLPDRTYWPAPTSNRGMPSLMREFPELRFWK